MVCGTSIDVLSIPRRPLWCAFAEPHVNRGGSNRKTKVSKEARKELEVRLAMERVNNIGGQLGKHKESNKNC